MSRIVVINGPNLNLLGVREPAIYGSTTLADLEAMVTSHAASRGATVECIQSNLEGDLVNAVQRARERADGAIVNLGGYTHTSIALRDAFLAAPIPFVEVHLSNLFRREAARHHSLVGDLALGVIAGFGARGYLLAVDALLAALRDE